MRKPKILVTILCLQLVQPSFAQTSDIELAARKVLTDLKVISSFVEQAHSCYQQLSHTEYREQFCKSQKNQLFNFETLTIELTQLKDQNYQKWLAEAEKDSPNPKYRASLGLVDMFYQDCKAYEDKDSENESSNDPYLGEIDPAPEVDTPELERHEAAPSDTNQIALDDIFPVDRKGELTFNVELYNRKIMSIESRSAVLDDPDSRALIESAREEGMKLRKELLLAEPILLNYALTQSQHYGEPSEIVFRLFQAQTGIDPKEIPTSSREFYDLYRQYERATDDLRAEGYRHPREYESFDEPPFMIERDQDSGEISVYKIDDPQTLPDNRPAFSAEMIIQKLNWQDNLLKKITIATSTQRPILENADAQDKVKEVLEKFSPRIQSWKKKVDEIENKYRKAVNADKSISESDTDFDQEGDFCDRQRNDLIREFSDQEMVVSFFENKDNRNFMTSKFDETKKIMKDMVKQLDLSEDSRQGMAETLDNVRFNLPDLNTKDWSKLQGETKDIMDKLVKEGLHDNLYLAYADAISFLGLEEKNKKYFDLEHYGSSNAFYHPHSSAGTSHSVSASCGIALPSVQENYPEFFMGIMAHELGHSLDPGYSAPNREKYSAKSLEKMDDLRRCLIKNNNGLHHRVSEDFADHFEAHFMGHWINSSKDDPQWPLRRQRYLHFSYSSICEDDSLKMEAHSDKDYRARHVLAHPVTNREFSEFNLPSVPFCPQLLPTTKGGQR